MLESEELHLVIAAVLIAHFAVGLRALKTHTRSWVHQRQACRIAIECVDRGSSAVELDSHHQPHQSLLLVVGLILEDY